MIIDPPEQAERLIEFLEISEDSKHHTKRVRVIDKLDKVTEEIRKIVPFFNLKDFYFAGGCIYSIWNDKEVKDYDIFCTNKKANENLIKYLHSHPKLVNCKTDNAFTVGKYQFIIKHIGSPDVEVAKFDFKHNCYYYNDAGLKNLFGWDYINSSELKFNSERARDILNIITRIPKFVSRGMEISQKEMLDILELGTRPTKYFAERKSIKQRQSGRSKY